MKMYLNITDGESNVRQFDLDESGSTFVGNGSNCRIMIDGAGVNDIHCLFWINDENELMIQDWNTGDTKVNGQVISEDVRLKSGDTITIGPNKIVPVLTPEFHNSLSATPTSAAPTSATPITEPQGDLQVADENRDQGQPDHAVEDSGEVDSHKETDSFLEPPPRDPDPSEANGKFAYDIDAVDVEVETNGNDFDFGISSFSNSDFESTGPLDAEEAELLRMEVEQLRFEIAERDAQLNARRSTRPDSTPVDEDQTIKLVHRLEELLEELQSSDDRVRGLEDLLRCSDQATIAEREERQQLESWVGEIEQRLIQREAEAEAEMSRVVSRLEEAKTRFQAAESQLEKVIQSKEESLGENSSELIRTFGEQVSELQEKLDAANQENETLRKQTETRQTDPKTQEAIHELEQKLMESQVESSQERASLARQRADLQRMQDELEQKLADKKLASKSDVRIQAMRQHLREIHTEERIEKEEKRRNSLGGRISRLLTRSEG